MTASSNSFLSTMDSTSKWSLSGVVDLASDGVVSGFSAP